MVKRVLNDRMTVSEVSQHFGVSRRTAYTEMLPDVKATSATCFLIRAVAWFKKHGLAIRRVMTDNGGCYRSDLFKTGVLYIQTKHVTTRPYTPRTNGKTERFIQTSIKEWDYCRA